MLRKIIKQYPGTKAAAANSASRAGSIVPSGRSVRCRRRRAAVAIAAGVAVADLRIFRYEFAYVMVFGRVETDCRDRILSARRVRDLRAVLGCFAP